jgi:hypothetical protein
MNRRMSRHRYGCICGIPGMGGAQKKPALLNAGQALRKETLVGDTHPQPMLERKSSRLRMP